VEKAAEGDIHLTIDSTTLLASTVILVSSASSGIFPPSKPLGWTLSKPGYE